MYAFVLLSPQTLHESPDWRHLKSDGSHPCSQKADCTDTAFGLNIPAQSKVRTFLAVFTFCPLCLFLVACLCDLHCSATSSWEPETYYFVVTWIFHVMGRICQRLSGWYDYLWLSQIHLNKADGNPYKPFYDYSIPYEPFLEMFRDQYQTWEARSPMFTYEALAVAWKLYLPGVFFLLGAGGWAPSFKGIGSQVDGIMWTLWFVILMWKYDTWSQTTGQIMKVCTSYVL